MKTRLLLTFSIFLCVFIACRKEELPNSGGAHYPSLPATPFDYVSASQFPSAFLYPPLNFINSEPASNPTTDWGATLGRVLFYDYQLSANNTIACASCHKQDHGFADDVRFSKGHLGGLTGRNSMAILNTRFSSRYFWDFRAHGLEQQVMMPIMNMIEMGTDTALLPGKLQMISYYPQLFQNAFGTSQINNLLIARALAQFVRSINSWDSRYDQGILTNFSNYTQEERDGETYFMSGQFNCNHCHTTNNLYNPQSLNNGLDSVYTDIGVQGITSDPADYGKFKVPTLRNIAMTAPYMHDGRFSTLEEVVEHYNSGIMPNYNLDDRLTVEGMTGGTPKRYQMTDYQKSALVAFLKTLTDDRLLADPKYSDPFAH